MIGSGTKAEDWSETAVNPSSPTLVGPCNTLFDDRVKLTLSYPASTTLSHWVRISRALTALTVSVKLVVNRSAG